MARDIFRGQISKDFARGEAPPSDSYEWAGVALPPPGRPRIGQLAGPVKVAGTTVVVIQQKKRSVWPWLAGIGAAVGGVLFYRRKKRMGEW